MNFIIKKQALNFRKAGESMDIVQDRNIAAILPRYSAQGDGVIIANNNGSEVFYAMGQRQFYRIWQSEPAKIFICFERGLVS